MEGRRSGPLFTSRTRAGGRRSARNHLGRDAAVSAMREALRDVCGMTEGQSKLYKGHSLRVGGSNHIRLLGVDDEVHRVMGGWASLTSSRNYFQLLEDEQFEKAEAFALKERVPPRVEGERAVPLRAVQAISIGG